MARPAQDARNKAQQIWPGATVAERGKRHIKHQHPTDPNRFMLDTAVGAKWHYGAGPYTEASEIDTAWVASAGAWDWEVTKNDFRSYIRDSVPVSYRYEDVATGHWVELTVNAIQWVNDAGQSENAVSFSQVTPTINDDEITWNNIAPGWHVMVRAETPRLAKWLTIDSLAQLGTPTIGGANIKLRFMFAYQRSAGLEIWADGIKWDEKNNTWFESAGAIEFRDETTQEPIFYIKQPIGNDDAGEPAPMSHRVRRSGVNFYAEVDTPGSWLQSAIFPISLDATIDTDIAAGADDGRVRSGPPDWSNSTSTIHLGYYNSASWYNLSGWFRFTGISGLSGATINTSYCVFAISSESGSRQLKIRANDVASPANPTSYSDYTGKVLTTAGVDWDASGTTTPSLNTIIQELADSYDPTAIMIMITNDGATGNDFKEVYAYEVGGGSEPNIHIEYTAGAAGDSIPYLSSLNKKRFQKLLVR